MNDMPDQTRATDDGLSMPRLTEHIVIRCLPVHYAIMFGGIAFGSTVAFLNHTYEWSGHVLPETEPELINLILILTCWLVPTVVVILLYFSHRGCQVMMISAGATGLQFKFSHKRQHTMLLRWERITDVQYQRWGLNISYFKDEKAQHLRMSPVFPYQVEHFMGRCHVIFMKRENNE